MARMTAARQLEPVLIEHVNPDVAWDQHVEGCIRHIQCDGRHPGWAEPQDVEHYFPTYKQALPATFVPNYTEGTYAACARASREAAADMRVLGFVHTDQPYYYDLVEHYDPLISLLVAVSDEVAASLAARLPHRAKDIRVKPYGVDVPEALARAWSDPADPLHVAYAGRLVQEQKNIVRIVPLVRDLLDRSLDFRLTIAGSGSDEAALREGLAELGPEALDKVEFVGRIAQEKMSQFWREADVSILVSDYEGTSISMLEAMANGCVPIVTDVSGTRATIEDGRNGFTVPVGDMRSMAERIAELAASRDRLSEMGLRAHSFVLQRHSIRDYVDWFEGLVQEAWQRSPRTWPDDRPLMPPRRCGAPPPTPITLWGRCIRFSGKVRRRLGRAERSAAEGE